MCHIIVQAVYNNLVCDDRDMLYIDQLMRDIITRITADNQETLNIGHIQVPVPPANVGQ